MIMTMLLVLVMGFVSLTNLKMDLMPDINPPIIAVMTVYPNASPEDVEELVTKPLENVISTSSGLKDLQSTSSQNTSLIVAQYNWNANIDSIRKTLDAQIEQVNLPEGAQDSIVLNFDPTMIPVMSASISTGDDIEKLQEKTNKYVVPALKNIDGVADVTLVGGFDNEVLVKLNHKKMDELGINQNQIVQMIKGNNIAMPGGVVENNEDKLNLRVLGAIENIDELKNVPISVKPSQDGFDIVLLKDVASVEEVKMESSSVAKNNGEASLFFQLQKEGDANTVDVATKVEKEIDKIKNKHDEFSISYDFNQGEIIKDSINNVGTSLMYGMIFSLFVILVFLRSFKSTFIIGISIPFSVISTFVFMYFNDMTLNMMSLGGLALGVGMLVDNAIVVIENISRHLSLGKTRKEAAIEGAREIAGAITASMLTTLCVFLPIVFVGGLIGSLFKELALTVVFSLLASWIVSLTVVPSLSGLMLKKDKREAKVFKPYEKLLKLALRKKVTTLFITIVLFVSSIVLATKVGTEFMPAQEGKTFTVEVNLPNESSIEKTEKVTSELENKILRFDEVDMVLTTIGSGEGIQSIANTTTDSKASIRVNLKDGNDTKDTMDKIKKEIGTLENVELGYAISNSNEMAGSNEVMVTLQGDNSKKLDKYTNKLQKRLKGNIKEVSDVKSSEKEVKKEFNFVVDKEKAIKYGMTTAQIGQFINQKVQGEKPIAFNKDGKEVEVRVVDDIEHSTVKDIENMEILTTTGEKVKIKELGIVKTENAAIDIIRVNKKRTTTLNVSFEDSDMGTIIKAIDKEINKMEKDLKVDENEFVIKVAGNAQEMNDSFKSLGIAFVLAIVFVYMVMASQFESLSQPLIIMVSMPLAIIGVVFGLYATGYAFGITAFIGIIILAGIVVNNAIVYVDYVNQLRESGKGVTESLIEAGLTRLRPIVMTALTTMLGLLPLAIGTGEGAQMQAPMAVAVIGGLFTSTFLTLIVIPVIYALIDTMKNFRNKLKRLMQTYNEMEDSKDKSDD